MKARMQQPSSATFKRHPPRGSDPVDAHALRHRLIGTTITAGFTLQSTDAQRLCLAGPTAALVAYMFPGSATSPAHGRDTGLADAEEHRSFRDLHEQTTALGLIVVGVSSQPDTKLKEVIAANRLLQPLASDPKLRLGELLRLPSFRIGDEHLYDRLTILIIAGKISQVFYPVPTPGRHAAEVLEHLTAGR